MSNNYGLNPGVDPNSSNPDDFKVDPGILKYQNTGGWTTAAINRQEQARYDQIYKPREDQLIKSLDNRDLIDNSRQEIADQNSLDNKGKRSLRDMRRYGLEGPTALQKSVSDSNFGLRNAMTSGNVINNAYSNQHTRNENLGSALINVGKGFAGDAKQSLRDSDAADQQRENANRAADDAASAQKKQQMAMAAMMLMMM
jgi:hypothetical protein